MYFDCLLSWLQQLSFKKSLFKTVFTNIYHSQAMSDQLNLSPWAVLRINSRYMLTYSHQRHTAFPGLLLQCESSNKDRGLLKAWKGEGSREEEEGVWGCLRKSSIKQSHMGEGLQTECWRGASVNFSTWSHTLACPLTIPTNIWSVVAATMQRPLKWRAEQTETGWVQCLSKVLIKPHSKYHWNQTNRSCLKALNLAMPRNKVWCGSPPLIITSKYFLPVLRTGFNLAKKGEQFTQSTVRPSMWRSEYKF